MKACKGDKITVRSFTISRCDSIRACCYVESVKTRHAYVPAARKKRQLKTQKYEKGGCSSSGMPPSALPCRDTINMYPMKTPREHSTVRVSKMKDMKQIVEIGRGGE